MVTISDQLPEVFHKTIRFTVCSWKGICSGRMDLWKLRCSSLRLLSWGAICLGAEVLTINSKLLRPNILLPKKVASMEEGTTCWYKAVAGESASMLWRGHIKESLTQAAAGAGAHPVFWHMWGGSEVCSS